MVKRSEQNSELEDEYIEIPDDRSDSEREHDRQIEKIDCFLSGLQPGVTLLIERIQPSWCSGLLEEITVPEDSLDLAYFIETWGGRILNVKVRDNKGRLGGRHKIPLNSYPPLVYGEPIDKPNPMDHIRRKDGDGSIQQSNQPVIVHPENPLKGLTTIIPTVLPLILKYVENQQNQRNQDMQMMLAMMAKQNNAGFADVAKMGSAFAQLKEVFRQENTMEAGGGDVDFLSQAMEVLKFALGNKQDQPQQQSSVLTPPRQPVAAIPAPKKSVVTPIRDRDLSQSLAELDPDAAVKAVQNSLGKMPPEKREAVIERFLSDFYDDMEDESEEKAQ